MPDRERVERPQAKRQQSSLSGSIPASSFPSASASTTSAVQPSVPSEPLPDSLVCRSTFTALEHSANTLKRLAKHVLHSSSAVMALLEQLENAEDQLMSDLGVLGRWLEGGYGVTGEVWDAEGGIRKVAKQKRAREREELEVMVGHSLEAVKGEIKRQGLAAGGHAGVKFEVSPCSGAADVRACQNSSTLRRHHISRRVVRILRTRLMLLARRTLTLRDTTITQCCFTTSRLPLSAAWTSWLVCTVGSEHNSAWRHLVNNKPKRTTLLAFDRQTL